MRHEKGKFHCTAFVEKHSSTSKFRGGGKKSKFTVTELKLPISTNKSLYFMTWGAGLWLPTPTIRQLHGETLSPYTNTSVHTGGTNHPEMNCSLLATIVEKIRRI